MSKIKILSPHEVQKIAAGEVIERPANIVKELIENSLDAHATRLTVMIEDGGKNLIRIIDNGMGMSSEDARLCIVNHATSKLSTVDELSSLQTFGFRGEALSSIAAVSIINLITKDDATDQGIHLIVQGGDVVQETPIATNRGTDIAIKNLFFNVPARKKFLKKRETEYRHIAQLIHAVALSHYTVHITLISDGHEIINCPPVPSLKDRCAQLWRHASDHTLHELHIQRDGIADMIGVITDQQALRYDRSELFFFVNKRWVTNFSLSNALIKGYGNYLPHGRYPFAAISITCDPQYIDINIHPRKEEVRFMHPKIIESLIQEGVKKSLETVVDSRLQNNRPKQLNTNFYAINEAPRISSVAKNVPTLPVNSIEWGTLLDVADNKSPVIFQCTESPVEIVAHQPSLAIQQPIMPFGRENQHIEFPSYQLIGQYKKTYLLLEQEDGLYLIDQHAAHERILYEKFACHFDKPVTTNLLFPIVVRLTVNEMEILQPYYQLFHAIGIMLEPFGVDQLIITATPVCAPHVPYDELIRQAVGWINQDQSIDPAVVRATVLEKLHAQMACKAAIKAGDALTIETMEQLLRDLYVASNRFSCPHGRPTGWLLPLHDIEKKFKRKS